jgi:hypothetical protein
MIYVFKTSVGTASDIEVLKPHLEDLPQTKWSFDLEDCDRILRIDSRPGISADTVIRILQHKGFACEVLLD